MNTSPATSNRYGRLHKILSENYSVANISEVISADGVSMIGLGENPLTLHLCVPRDMVDPSTLARAYADLINGGNDFFDSTRPIWRYCHCIAPDELERLEIFFPWVRNHFVNADHINILPFVMHPADYGITLTILKLHPSEFNAQRWT